MEEARLNNRQIKLLVLQAMIFALFLYAETVSAQIMDEPEFRTAVTEDGTVYLFHTATLPLGYKYNIYRRPAGSGEQANQRLNADPVRPVASEAELRGALGPLYWDLRATLSSASDGREILYILRNEQATGMMTTFLYHRAARALGRLWVDQVAEPMQTVIYTLEVLDEFDDPIMETFTYEAELTPIQPAPPMNPRAEHEDRYVTLKWEYPSPSPGQDDKVLRFEIFEIDEEDERRKVHSDVIIRNEAEEEFDYEITVAETGRSYTYEIVAVDIAGQVSRGGETVTIEVTDNTPPSFLSAVEGFENEDGYPVITWPRATEPKASGYYIYRAESTGEEAPMERLTDDPLPVNQTSYVDSLAGQSGETELWFYRVSVVSQAGLESEPSNAAMVHRPVFNPPPPADRFEAEVLEDGRVELAWEAPEMPENFAGWVILRVELRAGVPEDAAVQITPDSLFTRRFIDEGHNGSGLNEGANYEYCLIAYNGDRFASRALTAEVSVPKTTLPDAPQNLRGINEGGFRVQLNWNPVSDLYVDNYQIFRKNEGADFNLIRELPAPELSWEDESVEHGQTYIYAVTAVDEFGNVSEHSVPDTVFVRAAGIPRTVRNVRATVLEEGVVEVRWEPVPDSNLAGYRVFRSEIATGVYEEIHSGLVEETEFTDPEGSSGMWYRVRAYDTSTNESRPGEAAQATGGQ